MRCMVLNGHCVGFDRNRVCGFLQLFEVGQIADRGHDVNFASRVAGDRDGITGNFHRALRDDDVALVGCDAFLVIQLRFVGLNTDRLFGVVRQSPGAHASQCCAQAEQ